MTENCPLVVGDYIGSSIWCLFGSLATRNSKYKDDWEPEKPVLRGADDNGGIWIKLGRESDEMMIHTDALTPSPTYHLF